MSKSQYGTKSFRYLSREFQISKIVVLYICFSTFLLWDNKQKTKRNIKKDYLFAFIEALKYICTNIIDMRHFQRSWHISCSRIKRNNYKYKKRNYGV